MEKDILVNTFDETQEEFVPAGGIERIVAEIDEDSTESLWEQVAPDEEETPEAAVEEAEEVDVDLEPDLAFGLGRGSMGREGLFICAA